MIENLGNYHFTFIKKMNGLFKEGSHTVHCCDRCFTKFTSEQRLIENQNQKDKCKMYIDEAIRIFPKREEAFITFKNFKQRIIDPFVTYADIESMLTPIKNTINM